MPRVTCVAMVEAGYSTRTALAKATTSAIEDTGLGGRVSSLTDRQRGSHDSHQASACRSGRGGGCSLNRGAGAGGVGDHTADTATERAR